MTASPMISDIEEGRSISHEEMADVIVGGEEEDDVIRIPASDSSIKSKKKKKSKKNLLESSTESENERDEPKQKKERSETKSKKKKKKKKSKDDSSTPKTSPSSSVTNKNSDGSKRKKKKVSKINMAGDVVIFDADNKDIRNMHASDLESSCSSFDEEMGLPKKKKKKSKRDLEGKKKKKKSKSDLDGKKKKKKAKADSNEIESSSTKKEKREIPQIDDHGDIVNFNPNRTQQQKKKRRGKRPSETTLETYDYYDEENQNVRFSNRGKRRSESAHTQKTFDYDREDSYLRFSSSTLGSAAGSILDIYNSKSSPGRKTREYDGEYADDEDDHHVFADDDEDSYIDDEDDVYMREMGYIERDDRFFYEDSFYDHTGMDGERASFKRATFDLADTGIRDTKCCLIFAGIFFICTTVGTSMLLAKLMRRDEW